MRVAYLGPSGTFSEEAAFQFFSTHNIEEHIDHSIPDVFDSVSNGTVDYGVIPIENSIEGSVNIALDELLEHQDLFACGEIVLPIEQHLLCQRGVALDDIREVWSIPPALAQCRRFLRNHKWSIRHFASTAAAAHALSETGRMDAAAIGSAFAAKKLGLNVLAPSIQDSAVNHTRFLVLARGQQSPPDGQLPTKTLLALIPASEHAGVLASILQVFAAFAINLSWIVSRPAKTRLGMYQFVLDAEAGLNDDRIQRALRILDTYGHAVRVVGTFAHQAFQ